MGGGFRPHGWPARTCHGGTLAERMLQIARGTDQPVLHLRDGALPRSQLVPQLRHLVLQPQQLLAVAGGQQQHLGLEVLHVSKRRAAHVAG